MSALQTAKSFSPLIPIFSTLLYGDDKLSEA